jgi:hypothetical protein
MPRTCTICTHHERDAIDEALVTRKPYRNIAQLYGVSKPALSRHVNEHILPYLAQARVAQETDRAGGLVDRINELTSETRAILRKVKDGENKDLDLALKAIIRLERQLELEAKIEQVISDAPVINLHLSAEWLEVRGLILWALEPHQEARESVLLALEAQSNGKVWDGAYRLTR